MVIVAKVACVLLLSCSFAGVSPAHASSISHIPPPPAVDCSSALVTNLAVGIYSFRTQPTCTMATTRLADRAFAQYETPQDTSFVTIQGSQTQNSCNSCRSLFNPPSGGIVRVRIVGYPGGTCFRTYEIMSWMSRDIFLSKNVISDEKCGSSG